MTVEQSRQATGLAWGNLFLEKYNSAEAQQSFARVLKQNDKSVPALVGMAQATDNRNAGRYVDAALAVNPFAVSALVVRAALYITARNYGAADNTLQQALQINPESADALTLKAAIAYLKGDQQAFRAFEAKMQSLGRVDGKLVMVR